MPAQWTGELVGKMHNAGVTGKELAAQLGKNPKYISQVLNGHYEPKKAEREFNAALSAIIEGRQKKEDCPMAKKQFLKLRRLAEDQDITTDELAAKAGIVPRTLRKRFAAPESCGTWNWEEIDGICRALHIPQEQIGEHFFPKVEKGA